MIASDGGAVEAVTEGLHRSSLLPPASVSEWVFLLS